MKYYKLHLIRHGLTAGNLQGLYIGSGSDLPLCDEGRAQLKTLKKDFDYPVVPLVFTSPMKRATETAEILFPGVRQIELDDLAGADEYFDILMGDRVEPRRQFIEQHAHEVHNLDV